MISNWFPSDLADNGDDFQTPMSTPPSEAEDEGKGATTTTVTAADLSTLSLSEAQLYDRLYERCVTFRNIIMQQIYYYSNVVLGKNSFQGIFGLSMWLSCLCIWTVTGKFLVQIPVLVFYGQFEFTKRQFLFMMTSFCVFTSEKCFTLKFTKFGKWSHVDNLNQGFDFGIIFS